MSKTVEANGYIFSVEDTGTITATGQIQVENAARNQSMQSKAGGTSRLSDDHGGHIVAASQNGPAIPENLVAQNGNLNQGSYRAVERAETNAVKNDNVNIDTEKTAYVSNVNQDGNSRPDAFMVNDTITFADGHKEDVHLSFTNVSNATQQAWENELNQNPDALNMYDEVPNPGDVGRESMSKEEYAELMESTDKDLPSIGDMYTSWDNTLSQPENAEPSFADVQASVEPSSFDYTADTEPDMNAGFDYAESEDVEMETSSASFESEGLNLGGCDMEGDNGMD